MLPKAAPLPPPTVAPPPPSSAGDEDDGSDLNAANERVVEEVTLVDVDVEAERARQQVQCRFPSVYLCNYYFVF